MKTELTKQMERELVNFLYEKKYELSVLECTLGFGGRYGIVDVLSYHGKSVSNGRGRARTRDVSWRCYEIKSTKGDFYSKHKWTFEGDYNYFVMPVELYSIVEKDIPKGVGCYLYLGKNAGFKLIKRASKKKRKISDSEIAHDFAVSSTRDARRWMMSK